MACHCKSQSIFITCRPGGGIAFERTQDYTSSKAKTLTAQFSLPDIIMHMHLALSST